MTKLATLVSFCAALLAWSNSADATTGGPVTVRVLGWDSADQKLFFTIDDHSESGELPTLRFVSAKTGKISTARSWYTKGDDADDPGTADQAREVAPNVPGKAPDAGKGKGKNKNRQPI